MLFRSRGQVADYLGAIGIKTNEQRAFTTSAGRLCEGAALGRLGRAGGATDRHAGRAVVATAQHGIEPLRAAGNAFVGHVDVHTARRARNGDLKDRFCRSGKVIHSHQSWSRDTSARADCVATRQAPLLG